MTPTSAIGLILSILSSLPEIVNDVEKLVADFKAGAQPPVPLTPEVHAALDSLHARLMSVAAGAP